MTTGAIVGIVLGSIAGALLLLFLVMLIRTLANKPETKPVAPVEPADIDKELIAKHLCEAVRIPTVSMVDDYVDNIQPFIDYREWVAKTYPLLHEKAERIIIADYSIVYHLKGTNPSLKAGCFLSHIDVVPAPKDGWDYDPFAGVMTDDGFIYGRGAQDMKSHMIAVLEAVEYHLKNGHQFERDLWICLGHDEEPGQSLNGAPNIVKYLQSINAQIEFVVDEGGAVIDGNMVKVPHLFTLLGASEKGNGDLEIVVKKSGGHASNPNPPTADGVLADAILKVEDNKMKPLWTNLTKETFKQIAPYCNGSPVAGVLKFLLTNRDIFSPLLLSLFKAVAPMTNALVRTTFAPTVLWGSDARNVIPKEAKVNINFRMVTGNNGQQVKEYLEKRLKKYIKKGQIEVNLLEYSDPSPEADVNSEAYKNIRQSIWEAFPGAIVAPYMFIAADDARFYYPLTNNIFRFDPFVYNLEDQARIHGINERLHKDQLARGTQFFIRCLENTLIISK